MFLRLVLRDSLQRFCWHYFAPSFYVGHISVKGGQGAGKSSAMPFTCVDIFRRLHSSQRFRLFHVEVDHHSAGYLAILQCLTCFVEFGDPHNCGLQAQFAWPSSVELNEQRVGGMALPLFAKLSVSSTSAMLLTRVPCTDWFL